MTRTIRGLAASAGALLTALALVTGCSSPKHTDDTSGPSPVIQSVAPQDPQLARAAAEQVFSLIGSGDWAAAWDLWTAKAKSTVSKDVFVDAVSNCATGTYEVTDQKKVDDKTITVVWTRTLADGTTQNGGNTMRFEDGGWHFEPDAAALTAYAKKTC